MKTKREQLKELLPDGFVSEALDLFDSQVDFLNSEFNKKFEMLAGLYHGYKRTSDEDILKKLEKVKIVRLGNKGPDTMHGYYQLSDEGMKKILSNPRGTSLTFDAAETSDCRMGGLSVVGETIFLVKSTSRFFLKPDIGEVLDAIDYRSWIRNDIAALCVVKGSHEELPGTYGEHFLMRVQLLGRKPSIMDPN